MSADGHDSDSGHDRALEEGVAELAGTMVAHGHLTDEDIDAAHAVLDAQSPETGARIVARAWSDPAFRERLLEDGSTAVGEFGVQLTDSPRLDVVANSDSVHHLIVCTLCSCYPRAVLGLPPEWYKSSYYRSRAVRDPRGLLREFGVELPDEVDIEVHDSTADLRYLVLAQRPPGTDGWSEARLAALVTRNSMVGTGFPRAPASV